MQIKKICAFCGNEYVADRKNAKYCSDKCHQESIKAHRREETARRKSEMTEKANTQEKCDSCFYQSASRTFPTCDYILHTGIPRGCKAAGCDKYKPRDDGKQKSMVIFDRITKEEKAIQIAQREALSLRLDRYEIQRRHSKERKH